MIRRDVLVEIMQLIDELASRQLLYLLGSNKIADWKQITESELLMLTNGNILV